MRKLFIIAIAALIVGFVHSSTVIASVKCPSGPTVPVVSWLTQHIDSVTAHYLWWRPGNSLSPVRYGGTAVHTDAKFINGLLSLTGAYVKWNGYNSATPFGDFTYPRDGEWYEWYEIRTGQNVYQIWIWSPLKYTQDARLVFTFADMQQTTDGHGQHMGEHDFCMASVSRSAINKFDPDIYLWWR